MAKQNRTTLKGYFETGNTPSQAQYADLIDSKLNLSETGIQIVAGTVSSSILESSNNIIAKTHVTASGNISASGTINTQILEVNDLTSGRVILSSTNGRLADNLNLTFSSQTLTVTKIANIDTTHVTASGNISGSFISTGSLGSLKVMGSSVDFSGLPTSDPGVTGRLYNDLGIVKISL